MYCPRIFLLAITLLACGVDLSYCVTLEFYSGQNYSGYIDKTVVDKNDENKCIRLNKYTDIRSLKTDKCVMLYESEDCTRISADEVNNGALYTVRVERNTNQFPVNKDLYPYKDDNRGVWSFHVCSQELGAGPKLDIDLYSSTQYRGKRLKTWKDVWKCENVPNAAIPERWTLFSIDNHGNALNIFDEEHCRGASMFIPAGDSKASRSIYIEAHGDDSTNEIRSFRPAGYLDCIRLDASIYKFKFKNGSLSGGGQEEDVKMASSQTIINKGKESMEQSVEFTKSISNTVEYSVEETFTEIHSAGAKVGIETETEAGVPLVAGAKLKTSLEANYQYTREDGGSAGNTTSWTETEEVKITTTVKVAACEKCEVTGFIKVVQDFPINYTAEAMVSGKAEDVTMNAEEIKGYLPQGMEYVKDYDENNVVAAVDGSMRAEFAWKTFVSKDCEPVPDCTSQFSPGEKTHEIIEVPFVVVNKKRQRSSWGEYKVGMPISSPGEFQESALAEGDIFF